MARFGTVRSLTAEGLPLAEIRRALRSRGDNEAVVEALERLARTQAEAADVVSDLSARVAALEARLAELERPRPGWFRRPSPRTGKE